jgi:hypothetical protein
VTEPDDTDYYTSGDELGATLGAVTASAIGVVGFVVLLLVALGLWRQARLRSRAAKAAEEGAGTRKLAPGWAVIQGTIETDDKAPAMRVVIRQTGVQYRVKNGLRHRWTESSRNVETRPFFLVLESGERVKVEPDEGAILVDLLGIESGDSQALRTRTAEIRARDTIYATGRLVAPIQADAYRSAEQTFTLRAGGPQRMLLSTEPLEERFVKRTSFHARWAAAFMLTLLLVNGVFLHSYWNKLFCGRVIEASVVQPLNWTTQGKHGPIQHYGVAAQTWVDGNQVLFNPETSLAFYNRARSTLSSHRPMTAPFVVVLPDGKPYNIGTRPALHLAVFMVTWMLFIGLTIGYAVHTRHTRAWYERKRVVDVGNGPLGSCDALA